MENKGFGKGLLVGILSGVLIFSVLVMGVAKLYSTFTGSYIVLGGRKPMAVSQNEIVDGELADKVAELTQYMDLYYYDEYNLDEVREGLLDGMVAGIGDKYTVYYTPKEYEDLQVSTTGSYYGIGAGLSQNTETMVVTITKVYEGTPAEEAGLLKDDIIVSVGDVDATSMEVTDLVQLIRGEEGTTVHLEIFRASTKETLEFDVERRNVQLPSVAAQMLEGNIGYIQIAEFQSTTDEQFHEKLAELSAMGMQSLIVDLRDNPGGMLSSVVNILDEILPKGMLVYTEDKYGKRNEFTSEASCINYPMVVLINGNSASASEIFAGAIKDYEYGTLLGTNTFGKGIVQTIYPLSDGDALKVTTARYFTPNGEYIHGKGIAPDVEMDYEFQGPEGASYDMQYDNQLQEAIKLLSE